MYFCPDGSAFLQNLARNNNRDWFQDHKVDYDRYLKHPAEAFAISMAAALEEKTGRPHRFKIFRIFRDVRFSKDKTPYNTHMRISFTPVASGDAVSWFFSLERDHLVLGAGLFGFQDIDLNRYRQRVIGPDGKQLQKLLTKFEPAGIRLSEPELKRVPAAFDADHPYADLLRRKGICAWIDMPDARLAFGEEAVENCLGELLRLKPLFDWLITGAR